ncbi:MAG: hypothetical protein ABWZ25_20190 [Chitinophagaceae bacterium]
MNKDQLLRILLIFGPQLLVLNVSHGQSKVFAEDKLVKKVLEYFPVEQLRENRYLETNEYASDRSVTYEVVNHIYTTNIYSKTDPSKNRSFLKKEYSVDQRGKTLFNLAGKDLGQRKTQLLRTREFLLSSSPYNKADTILFRAYPIYKTEKVVLGYDTYEDLYTYETWTEEHYTSREVETGKFEYLPMIMVARAGKSKVCPLPGGAAAIHVLWKDTTWTVLNKTYKNVLVNAVSYVNNEQKETRVVMSFYAKNIGLIREVDDDKIQNVKTTIDLIPAGFNVNEEVGRVLKSWQDSLFSGKYRLSADSRLPDDLQIDKSLVGLWSYPSYNNCLYQMEFFEDGRCIVFNSCPSFDKERKYVNYFWRSANGSLYLYPVNNPYEFPGGDYDYSFQTRQYVKRNNNSTGKPELIIDEKLLIAVSNQSPFKEDALALPVLSGIPDETMAGSYSYKSQGTTFNLKGGLYTFHASGTGIFKDSGPFSLSGKKLNWGIGTTGSGKTICIRTEDRSKEVIALIAKSGVDKNGNKVITLTDGSTFTKVQ